MPLEGMRGERARDRGSSEGGTKREIEIKRGSRLRACVSGGAGGRGHDRREWVRARVRKVRWALALGRPSREGWAALERPAAGP